jgi:hypothetical protein
MAFGHVGVEEVGRGVVDHADLLHDAARAQVGGDSEGNEAGEV